MDSILNSVKKYLGISSEYEHFDPDIIMFINTSFNFLHQLGIGPEQAYSIKSSTEVWTEFLGERTDLEAVKTYVYLKVKLMFDPPSNSFLIESMNKILSETEWRLTNQTIPKGV